MRVTFQLSTYRRFRTQTRARLVVSIPLYRTLLPIPVCGMPYFCYNGRPSIISLFRDSKTLTTGAPIHTTFTSTFKTLGMPLPTNLLALPILGRKHPRQAENRSTPLPELISFHRHHHFQYSYCPGPVLDATQVVERFPVVGSIDTLDLPPSRYNDPW